MTPETPTKTLAELRAEYDAAKETSEYFDHALEPEYEALDEAIEKLQAKFNADHRDTIMESARLSALAKTAESDLRAAIVAQYEAAVKLDPKASKTLGHGCSVRVTETMHYETSEAVKWATEKMPIALRVGVDKKLFEHAIEVMEKKPEFVTIKETVTAVVKG